MKTNKDLLDVIEELLNGKEAEMGAEYLSNVFGQKYSSEFLGLSPIQILQQELKAKRAMTGINTSKRKASKEKGDVICDFSVDI